MTSVGYFVDLNSTGGLGCLGETKGAGHSLCAGWSLSPALANCLLMEPSLYNFIFSPIECFVAKARLKQARLKQADNDPIQVSHPPAATSEVLGLLV